MLQSLIAVLHVPGILGNRFIIESQCKGITWNFISKSLLLMLFLLLMFNALFHDFSFVLLRHTIMNLKREAAVC